MLDAKFIADLITATRGLLGLFLIWLGLSKGEESLPLAIFIAILCWTGDFVDGSIARLDRHHRKSALGDHDLEVDLFVSICMGAYLVGAGFVSLALGITYLIGWAALFWLFGLDHTLLMAIQAPLYLCFILVSLCEAPNPGFWILVWILMATTILWRRFSSEVVPEFIKGMQSLGHHRRH